MALWGDPRQPSFSWNLDLSPSNCGRPQPKMSLRYKKQHIGNYQKTTLEVNSTKYTKLGFITAFIMRVVTTLKTEVSLLKRLAIDFHIFWRNFPPIKKMHILLTTINTFFQVEYLTGINTYFISIQSKYLLNEMENYLSPAFWRDINADLATAKTYIF